MGIETSESEETSSEQRLDRIGRTDETDGSLRMMCCEVALVNVNWSWRENVTTKRQVYVFLRFSFIEKEGWTNVN